jgi:hypothetical protein
MFHAHLAYPDPRKRRATRACEDGHVGGSHRSCEWRVARRVWRMLHCVNPSPAGLSGDPNGRWLLTLGPAPKVVKCRYGLIHRCWQTLTTRAIQDERDAWSTSDLTSAENAGYPKQGAIPAWVRNFRSTQGGPVMGSADRSTGVRGCDTGKRISE